MWRKRGRTAFSDIGSYEQQWWGHYAIPGEHYDSVDIIHVAPRDFGDSPTALSPRAFLSVSVAPQTTQPKEQHL